MFKGNKWLVGGVVVVAAISVGLYVYRFWGKPLSTDPGDWADFATYLSGTVGVAAVVATLLAFVKTLGQQQTLIDSQDLMLQEQRRQIELVEEQNRSFEENNKLDHAYSNAKEISPVLVGAFIDWSSQLIFPYEISEPILYDGIAQKFGRRGVKVSHFFRGPEMLFLLFTESPTEEVASFLNRFFRPIEIVYRFACDQIKVAPDLKVYFEADLMSKLLDDANGKFYFHCYQAFLVGRNDDLYLQGAECFDLEKDYSQSSNSLITWQEMGELLKAT